MEVNLNFGTFKRLTILGINPDFSTDSLIPLSKFNYFIKSSDN